MGFKTSFLLYALADGRLVFDVERQALAKVLCIGFGQFALRYCNGGVAVLRQDTLGQFYSEQIPWVPTHNEILAWKERKDTTISRSSIVFGGDTIPDSWWGVNQQDPVEPVLSFV